MHAEEKLESQSQLPGFSQLKRFLKYKGVYVKPQGSNELKLYFSCQNMIFLP